MFLILAMVVAAAVVAAAGYIAMRNKALFAKSNQLIPGQRTNAPAAWAGSHDPEARLHRRLVDALAALRTNQAFDDDGRLLDLRVELEQQAQSLDDQLVSTAALAPNLKAEPLARLSDAVASVEQAIADLATASTVETGARLDAALEDIRQRTGLVAQARAALDQLPPVAPLEGPPTAPAPPVAAPAPPPPPPGEGEAGQAGPGVQPG